MLRSSLSRWMQRISHQMTVSRVRGRRRPQPQIAAEIATLEPRALLAGVVNVAFAAGTLTITGVDNLTQAGIVGLLNDQEIQMTGGAPGQVTVAGLGGETVNGGGTFNGVTNIKVDLKEGSDFLFVKGTLTLTGGLTFLGGNGGETFELDDAAVVSLGSLTITTLEGSDNFDLTPNNTMTVTGAVTINSGAGGTTFTVKKGVFGSLKFTSGDGSDNLDFENLDVTGTSQITCGDGDAGLVWDTNSSLGGNLTVNLGETGGDSGHNIELNLQSAKGVSITTTSGAKTISLSGTYVGNVSLTNGIGHETTLFPQTVITGNLTIKNGSGGSDTNFTGSVEITGNVAITNLTGTDHIIASGTVLTVTGTTTISNGNGGGSIELRPTGTLNLSGNLSITDGEGDNEVVIGKVGATIQTLKNVSMNHGVGDSITTFFGTVAMGIVTLTGGEGDHNFETKGATTTKDLTLNFVGSNFGMEFLVRAALTVNGNLKMTTGSGRDALATGTNLNISGTTTVSTGAGDDFVNFRNATLTGNVSVTTGSGADQVRIGLDGASTLAGNLTLNTGTGDDSVIIDRTTFRGTVSVSLGAGSDSLDIEDLFADNGIKTRFEKAVTINAEAGDDRINIGLANDTDDFAEFLSTLTINAGSGVDIVKFKNIAGGGTRSNIFTVAPTLSGVEAAV